MANVHGLPKTLKIGALTYKVRALDREQLKHFEEQDVNVVGQHSYNRQEIDIHPGIKTKEQVIDVKLHEVLHALWDHYDLPTENEERIVTALGGGLTMFFKDNPEVVSYIKRYLK